MQQIWETWQNIYGEEPLLSEAHLPASVSLVMPLREEKAPGKTREYPQETIWSFVPIDDATLTSLLASVPEGLTPQEVHDATGISKRSAQERLKRLWEEGSISREKDGRFYRYKA